MNSMNAGISFLTALLTMASLASTAKQWNITAGNDLWNLYAFNVAGNWQGEDAPNAAGDNVKFSGSAVQYIQLPENAPSSWCRILSMAAVKSRDARSVCPMDSTAVRRAVPSTARR